MTVKVELQYDIKQFKDCHFRFNDKTGCFEVYHIEDMQCYTTIVAMFPKENVIGIYYKEKKE